MKPSSIHLAATFLAAAVAVAGCSRERARDAVQGVRNMANDPQVNGTFSDQCSSSRLLDASEKKTLIFAGNQFTQHQIFYSERDCRQEIGRITYRGEFTLDSDAAKKSLGGHINITLQSAEMSIQSQTLANMANAVSLCGHENFEVNKKVDLTQHLNRPQDRMTCPLKKVPVTLYGLYNVRDGRLTLSDDSVTSMAESADRRQNRLNREHVYQRGSR